MTDYIVKCLTKELHSPKQKQLVTIMNNVVFTINYCNLFLKEPLNKIITKYFYRAIMSNNVNPTLLIFFLTSKKLIKNNVFCNHSLLITKIFEMKEKHFLLTT